jgi:prevent-host-death family protein
MSEVTVSDARARLADVVDAARVQHDPIHLTRRGQRVAAVIDAEDLDRLIVAAEDLADIEAEYVVMDLIDDVIIAGSDPPLGPSPPTNLLAPLGRGWVASNSMAACTWRRAAASSFRNWRTAAGATSTRYVMPGRDPLDLLPRDRRLAVVQLNSRCSGIYRRR